MDFSGGSVRGADRDRALAGIQWMNEAFEAFLADLLTRIYELTMVLYRQAQSPCLDFWGSDVRSHTTEGDTQWVN